MRVYVYLNRPLFVAKKHLVQVFGSIGQNGSSNLLQQITVGVCQILQMHMRRRREKTWQHTADKLL